MNDVGELFFEQLRVLYEGLDTDRAAFQLEEPILRAAIPAIVADLGPTFVLREPLGRGGAGLVIRIRDENLGVDRALKIPRPRQTALIESVRNERDHLRTLRHDNLIRLHRLGDVALPGQVDHFP